MINFRFLKTQISYSWVILVSFIIASLVLVIPTLIGAETFSDLERYVDGQQKSNGTGATNFYFFLTATGTVLVSTIMSILIINRLFVKEIDRGYIGAWLVLPISKTEIYATKIFVIITYVFAFHAASLAFQEVLYYFLLWDFNKSVVFYLFTFNLSMFLVSLLMAAITLATISLVKKSAIGIAIISTMMAVFVTFYLIALTAPNPNDSLHVIKFFTIYNLLQSSAKFDLANPIQKIIAKNEYYQYYQIANKGTELAWKIPLTTILLVTLFIFAPLNLKNRNLSI